MWIWSARNKKLISQIEKKANLTPALKDMFTLNMIF